LPTPDAPALSAPAALIAQPPSAASLLPSGQRITAADLAICRGFIQHHSKSFYFSSLLLPAGYRYEAWAIYAFCRQADDTVDGENLGNGQVAADAPTELALILPRIDGLRQRLGQVYRGQPGPGPDHAIDRAFLTVVERCGLPRAVPERLLLGMEMDARGTHYQTWDELLTYCFCVASTVGLMMTYVLGQRMPAERRREVMLRACDLGVGMQLTNIARDIGEDGRRGRVYLPDELLQRYGLDSAALLSICQAGGPAPPALRQVVAELLERAAAHYRAARLGIPMLTPAAWLGIRSAERIYRGIGEKLAQSGADPLRGRAYVSTLGKLQRLLAAWLVGLLPQSRRLPLAITSGPADRLLGELCRDCGVSD
jgi:phytoene synthase